MTLSASILHSLDLADQRLMDLGTCCEWTTDPHLPYDGFRVDMYAYMPTLQFGTHKTTRGGSTATSASLIRNTYRQSFHPDRFDVFTGFRTCAAPEQARFPSGGVRKFSRGPSGCG